MIAALKVLLIAFGILVIWCLGYLKGRWDAGRSIAKRYYVKRRPE